MWYSTGTVSVTNGSSTVTGSGTEFLANARIGDGIVIQGSTAMHEIIGIASDTSLTIRPGYTGTTGAGRQFAVAPMLGYDKDLSDAFNEIRLQFGDTLSALKPWAYAATAAAARNELGLGSAALRQAIGTAPLYGRDSVVGTVSQSGGVPTGALVQYGSNENGEFWRYAGGMQICRHNMSTGPITEANGSIFLSDENQTWQYPASFSGSASLSGHVSSLGSYSWVALGSTGSIGSSSGSFRVARGSSLTSAGALVALQAIGRWHS